MTETLTTVQTELKELVSWLNTKWKLEAVDKETSVYTQLEIEEGRKYIKVWSYLMSGGERTNGRSCFMFVDKNTGEVYKPASCKAPAKGVRYQLHDLYSNPHQVDAYGGFLYIK